MDNTALRHPFTAVERNGRLYYGGSQTFSEKANIRKCGCGPVAALNTLIYLHRYHTPIALEGFEKLPDEGAVSAELYNELLERLVHRFLPLIPTRGINAVTMAAGLNVLFIRHKLPYRVTRCVLSAPLWERAEDMLRRDIPVMFSVGVNFPDVWGKKRLRLYCKNADGGCFPSGAVKGHYMTMTGLDGEWMCVSSWGRRYYISRKEFEEYAKDESVGFLCNILYIK